MTMHREIADDLDRDDQALALREQGRPFGGIAEILELDSAGAAHASFNRALRLRPRAEQERLRNREMARLDALSLRLRARDDLSVEEIVRRLRGVKHQRKTLFVT
jgi:DNA-binding transcriptional MerR regulator